jgi:hypothetical protein
MFTASMSNAERAEAYNRLTAKAGSNGKELKICYVTVCFPSPVMICLCILCGSPKGLEKARNSTIS